MEGPDKFHRFVVFEFPTFEQGVACFTSPEYNRAAAFRRNGAGVVTTYQVEWLFRQCQELSKKKTPDTPPGAF
jgi:enoyl-[acyl-carrier-protein] reductase (NADH)